MIKLLLVFICLFNAAFALSGEERILRQSILYSTGENYLQNAYYGGKYILRWNKTEFPIKVYIQNSLNVPNYYAYAFIKAAAIWQGELDDVIRLLFVTDEDEADIAFLTIPNNQKLKNNIEETFTLAYTEPLIKGKRLVKMNIYVYEKNQSGQFFKPFEILNVSIHEFAHALGMSGHSPHPSSIMHSNFSPLNEKTSAFISREDKNTIKLLYSVIPDITNGDKTKEEGNMRAEILTGSEEERIDNSINNLLEEIKIKPGDSMSRSQLAALYEQKNDLENMYKYLHEAENCAKTPDEFYAVEIGYTLYYFAKKDKINAFLHLNKANSIKKDGNTKDLENKMKKL